MRIATTDAGDFAQGRVAWDVLRAAREHAQTPLDVVDLSGSVHLKPYSIATIAAIALSRTSDAPLVLRLPEDQRCRDHVCRLGLPRALGVEADDVVVEARDTNVAVRQLTQGPGAFSSEAMRVWDRALGGMDPGVLRTLADHLDEIILNALGHSHSPIGCVVAGQAFPVNRQLEITVVDLGQTFLAHLRHNPEHQDLRSDAEAIQRATEDEVTGTPRGGVNALGEPNTGSGLYDLKRYCQTGGGEMTILSGSSMATYSGPGDPIIQDLRGGFPGSLVSVRFFT